MKWLYRIFSLLYGCRHKWTILQKMNTYEFDSSTRPCEVRLILKCEKCGDVKTRKV